MNSKTNPVAWLRDIDGTGSLHVCAADDKGAIPVYDTPPRGDVEELLEAGERALRLFDEALPQFNWAESPLDADAISLLNEVPQEVRSAVGSLKDGA